MLCYISGICYIFYLKIECNYILFMNSPSCTLSKWIEHSLHLRKRKTDVNAKKALNNQPGIDLANLPLLVCVSALLAFVMLLQCTNCFVPQTISIWRFLKFKIWLIPPERKENSSNATFLEKPSQNSHQGQVLLFYIPKATNVKTMCVICSSILSFKTFILSIPCKSGNVLSSEDRLDVKVHPL